MRMEAEAEVTAPVHLDFETFSEVTPRGVGSCRYAEHPSTEVLCLAYAIGDEDPRLWKPGDRPPRELFDHVARGARVYAWNAEFEIPVWRTVCVDRMFWPDVPLNQWRDTAAVALSLSFPANLEDCGAALDLDIRKDRRGHHLVNKLCKPRKPSKLDASTRWTPRMVPKDFADLYAYCRQDVRSERAIAEALPIRGLPTGELATWRMTVEMNLRGWSVDIESVELMLLMLAEHRERALDEISELTLGLVETDGQREKALEWLSYQGVHLPNYQMQTIEDRLKKKMPWRARRFLELRQELSKISTKKYDAMRVRLCDDGTVKNNILYHGAGTGRDAGRGIQIQNFPRANVSKTEEGVEDAFQVLRSRRPLQLVELVYGSVPHFASKMLRSMLVARDGMELFAADLSSIENRVTVWYADCEYGIEIFRKGLDQYRMFGRDYYHVTYEDVTEDQREHSKHTVLGCCFGMGVETFMKLAERFGHPCTRKEAQQAVDTYRELYHEVVQFWYDLDHAAKRAVKKGIDTAIPNGKIKFTRDEDFLYMVLASGRRLAYFRPKVQLMPTPWGAEKLTVTHMGTDPYTKKWSRIKIIPGRFAENAVQATARDVMMEGAHATIDAGYTLVGRVHDELISERLVGEGSAEEYAGLMGAPSWLVGIPIMSKGWSGRRYRK